MVVYFETDSLYQAETVAMRRSDLTEEQIQKKARTAGPRAIKLHFGEK